MVVPTLGERPDMLAACIASIEAQDADVEIVIVTRAEALPILSAEYPRVRVVAQRATGIADAIESGWSALPQSTGYVAWLGDDDLLCPGSLSAACDALDQAPEATMVYGRCLYIDEAGTPLREVRPGRIARILLAFGQNLIAQPGALYRLSAIRGAGGLEKSLRLAFDVDLHRRLSMRGRRAIYVPIRLGMARTHSESLTTRERSVSQAEATAALTRLAPTWIRRSSSVCRPMATFARRAAFKVSSRGPA
jgi:GT2 family glycosyltransferase